MKRERIIRAIEKSRQRHLGYDVCCAVVRARVSDAVVTHREIVAFTREWGIKDASIEGIEASTVQTVRFLVKTFSRADTVHHATFLRTWFKILKARGARVELLNATGPSEYHYRSMRRGRASGRLPAR